MQRIEDPARELFERLYTIHQEPDRAFPPAQLVEWLDTLPYITPEQREVLRLRTGLADGYRYALEEIAAMRHRSLERVRQIEETGLSRLRHAHATAMMERRYRGQPESAQPPWPSGS